MSHKSLSDRMKAYETVTTCYALTRRIPVILRLDGKAFHSLTKILEAPYDDTFHRCMCQAAIEVCAVTQGSKLAYHFSDEISILLVDYDTVDTDAYFAYNLQKLVSITASLYTARFAEVCLNTGLPWCLPFKSFDCRSFNVPRDDVVNYFLFRQQDCTRNSIQTLARCFYSHKELLNKNTSEMQDMLMEKGVNWNDQTTIFKRGVSILKGGTGISSKWVADYEAPIFTKNRDYIERLLEPEPEPFELPEGNKRFKDLEALGFKQEHRQEDSELSKTQ